MLRATRHGPPRRLEVGERDQRPGFTEASHPAQAEEDHMYKRVILKVSGEFLAGEKGFGIDPERALSLAHSITEALSGTEVELAVVIGGGNLWRARATAAAWTPRRRLHRHARHGHERHGPAGRDGAGGAAHARHERHPDGGRGRAVHPSPRDASPGEGPRRDLRRRERAPFFTTDTTATLRALEIGAEVVLMAKNSVDGVYDSDPRKNADAVRYDSLTHMDVVEQRLEVMDATAITLCMDKGLDIVVFDIFEPGNLRRLFHGERVGTLIHTPKA